MASNLHNAFNSTDGNVMTVLGSLHVMKSLPDGELPLPSASAIQQLADKGVTTISIDLLSRDHEFDKATLSIIPESTKPQYLKADCHSSLSNIDLSSYLRIETGIKLAQACDAIITIPKLAA
jgi:kynurenine formamidase